MNYKKNDEVYTPSYIVKPLLKYIPKNYIIWLPFDTEKSNYYKTLKKENYTIITTGHQDFFKIKPNFYFDIIISNIPYSLKRPILEKIKKNKWKYCILVSCMAFANKGFNNCLVNESFNLICFNERLKFYEGTKQPSFNSFYITNDLIKNNIMVNIDKKNMIIDTKQKETELRNLFNFEKI